MAFVLAFSFLAIAFSSLQFLEFAGVGAIAHGLSPISLTIVGANGTQVVLNENDVAALPSYRAYGGYKNQLGIMKGLGNYTGVSLSTLCSLVGGLTNMSIVKVFAEDYNQTFTYAQVNGDFVTYDPVTGAEVSHSQPLVPIVAYYFNDVDISESNGGPLKLAIVGPEGLVTNSTYWVKWVIRVEVIDESVPEFSPPMVLSLLLFATSIVAISFKAFRRRQLSAKRFYGLTGECGQ